MMNGMERLAAAVNGTKADRIPVFCNLLDQGAKELGMSIRDYYSNGENVAEAQLKMREKNGYDNLWCLFYVGKEAQLLGCRKMIFADDGPPNLGEMIIKKLEDIERFTVPESITGHPSFSEELKCIKILKREAGGKYPVCAYITSSMTMPVLLMGMEKWIPMLISGPVSLRDELLEKCHDFFVKEVAAYREAGADIIVYSNPFGSTDIIPLSFFTKSSLPWIKKDIEAAGTGGMVYYCGGAKFNTVLETVINETGIGTYYLSPLDDLAEGKKIINGRGLCCGVINDIRMIDWTPEQVRQEVKGLIDAGKPGGKFLLGTLVMPYGIPEDNIRAYMEAAEEYGRWN